MDSRTSVFEAEYIIDGIRRELSPGQILDEAAGIVREGVPGAMMHGNTSEIQKIASGALPQDDVRKPGTGNRTEREAEVSPEPIVDESVDPGLEGNFPSAGEIYRYIAPITRRTRRPRNIPSAYAASLTKGEVARALLDMLWRAGHFRLDDLQISAHWEWDRTEVGNLAAFYYSAESLGEYLDQLGVRLGSYDFKDDSKQCCIRFDVSADGVITDSEDGGDDDIETPDIAESIDRDIQGAPEAHLSLPYYEMPFRTANPVIGRKRICSSHISRDKSAWLIYIPFDTCGFRLGGSLLSEVSGICGGKAPDISDSDYFIDCYEVVREFAEDGVITAGVTVGPGGLVAALSGFTTTFGGIDADISGIMRSYEENDIVKILFGETPGVLMEIRDSDFDYVDAELLLQDVAYFPVGHPGRSGLRISHGGNGGGILGILQSLLDTQTAEGED